MIASAHIAAGAVVGVVSARASRHPVVGVGLALVAGFLSHFALDMVPHADYAPFSRPAVVRLALTEVAVSSLVVWLLLRGQLSPTRTLHVLAGMGASALPDAKFVARLVFPPDTAERIAAFGDGLHQGVHAAPPVTLAAGWGAEIAIAVMLLGTLAAVRWRAAPRRDAG